MPIDTQLIPDPVLDDRLEMDRIAARINRSIGGLTVQDAELIVAYGQALRAMIGNNWTVGPINATSFTLTYNGQTTVSLLTSGLTALAIQAALAALPSVGTGKVSVSDNGDGTYAVSFDDSVVVDTLSGAGTGAAASITIVRLSNQVTDPLLPELSSARPAEAHTVILTELERMSTATLYRFNQLPDKNRVGFLRLLGTILNPSHAATTLLQFIKTADFLDIDVFIPAGTVISTADFKARVSTDADLDIAAGTQSATVSATAAQAGDIGRLPVDALCVLTTSIAGIASVANVTVLAGGRAGETTDQAKIRARETMRIGQHLGSTRDWIDYIYFNLLLRKGRITGFEGYLANFTLAGADLTHSLGTLLLVIQDDTGASPAQNTLNNVASLIAVRHIAGLQVAVTGPLFRVFDLAAQVTIAPGTGGAALIARATGNLRAFFDPLRFPYGTELVDGNLAVRYISLSDIVGQIEAAGPRSISVKTSGNQFAITLTIDGQAVSSDVALGVGELPMLGKVTLMPF